MCVGFYVWGLWWVMYVGFAKMVTTESAATQGGLGMAWVVWLLVCLWTPQRERSAGELYSRRRWTALFLH